MYEAPEAVRLGRFRMEKSKFFIKMIKIQFNKEKSKVFCSKTIENLHKKFANFLNIMYNIYKRKRMERFTETGELQSQIKGGFPRWKNVYSKLYRP